MPQLNPAPWFAILVFTWVVFVLILPNKVINHSFPNELTPPNAKQLKTSTWNWPWH